MRKSVFWIVALMLCLFIGTASASIDVVGPEVCYSYSSYDDGKNPDIYFLVEVKNNGSSAAALDYDSSFAIYDASGAELKSGSVELFPKTIMPGKTGYAYVELSTDLPDSSSIKSYKFNLVTDDDPLYETVQLFEGVAIPEDNDVYVRMTNTTSETLWDTYGFIIALDAQGRPLYINDTIAYQIGVPAGQSLEYPMFFNKGHRDFLTENGMEPVNFVAGGVIYDIN